MLMGTTQMLHAGFAAGAEEDAGSFSPFFLYNPLATKNVLGLYVTSEVRPLPPWL